MRHLIILLGLTAALAACAPLQDFQNSMMARHQAGASGMHHDMASGEDHAAMYAEHHADDIAAAIAAPDRPEAQVARDEARQPADTLSFSQIHPGSRVMDLGAGGGYYTRLVSSLVGPEGHVTGQNPRSWVDGFGADWPEVHGQLIEDRGNVDFVVAELDDLGVAPGSLDAVTMMLVYHDSAPMDLDRADMNAGIFAALKPGGLFLVSDHYAPEGSGTEMADTLHRIDAALVMDEVLAAGFVLVGSSDALRHPDDDRSLIVFNPEIRGRTDRFVYLFRKP